MTTQCGDSCKNAKVLSDEELIKALADLPDWKIKNGKLFREFTFKNFSEAFAFMTRAAMVSEKLNHHPDWSNSYNKLAIELTTHAAGGVTDMDLTWAKAVHKFEPKS